MSTSRDDASDVPRAARGLANPWIAAAALAVATALAYAASLGGEFVWDDRRFILFNPAVKSPESWLRFLTDGSTVDTMGSPGIVRPLRTLEFAIDWRLSGGSPAAFHVHSLLWHVAAAVLLLFVLRRLLGGATIPAFLAALVWAVHPAQVESVAFISSRGDVAMGACAFASVLFALRSKGFDRDLAASLAAAAVAALYKETAVALLPLIAVLRWTRLARVPVWPYAVVTAAYLVYRSTLNPGAMDHRATFVLGGSTSGTIATMIRAFGFYLADAFLPAQALDWDITPSTSFADAAVLGWLAVHAALVASAVVFVRRRPVWTLAVAWFYVCFGPVANWPVFLRIATSERFMYLPLAGFAIAVGVGLARTRRTAWIAAGVIAAALAVQTASRCSMWRNEDGLWAATLADHESSRGRESAAKILRREALALRDQSLAMPAGEERARAFDRVRAMLEESLDDALRSLEDRARFELMSPSRSTAALYAHTVASSDCHLLGRDLDALAFAEEALRLVASDPFAHYDRAQALAGLGYAPQAMDEMRRARSLGFSETDELIALFFLQTAAICEESGLLATAQAGYETAAETAPQGPRRAEAQAKIDALKKRPRAADAERVERERLAQLDAALAAVARPDMAAAVRRRP